MTWRFSKVLRSFCRSMSVNGDRPDNSYTSRSEYPFNQLWWRSIYLCHFASNKYCTVHTLVPVIHFSWAAPKKRLWLEIYGLNSALSLIGKKGPQIGNFWTCTIMQKQTTLGKTLSIRLFFPRPSRMMLRQQETEFKISAANGFSYWSPSRQQSHFPYRISVICSSARSDGGLFFPHQ